MPCLAWVPREASPRSTRTGTVPVLVLVLLASIAGTSAACGLVRNYALSKLFPSWVCVRVL
jgi:hypothetical protein